MSDIPPPIAHFALINPPPAVQSAVSQVQAACSNWHPSAVSGVPDHPLGLEAQVCSFIANPAQTMTDNLMAGLAIGLFISLVIFGVWKLTALLIKTHTNVAYGFLTALGVGLGYVVAGLLREHHPIVLALLTPTLLVGARFVYQANQDRLMRLEEAAAVYRETHLVTSDREYYDPIG